MIRDDCGRVSADGHETGVTERKLSGVAVDEIQTDGKDDVDADVVADEQPVGIDLIFKKRNEKAKRNCAEQKSFGVARNSYFLNFLFAEQAGRLDEQN